MKDSEVEITFRTPTESDLDAVFEVIRQAHGDWPGLGSDVEPRAYLDWKTHSSVDSMGHHMTAWDDERMVGLILRIVRTVKLGDRINARPGRG